MTDIRMKRLWAAMIAHDVFERIGLMDVVDYAIEIDDSSVVNVSDIHWGVEFNIGKDGLRSRVVVQLLLTKDDRGSRHTAKMILIVMAAKLIVDALTAHAAKRGAA
jgi:hypothetical protein